MGLTLVVTELSYRYIETPIRKGALGSGGRRCATSRDPGRRNAVLAGAFVGTALAIFGVTSLATAELKQNDVQLSLERGRGVDLRRARRPDVQRRRRPRCRSAATRPPTRRRRRPSIRSPIRRIDRRRPDDDVATDDDDHDPRTDPDARARRLGDARRGAAARGRSASSSMRRRVASSSTGVEVAETLKAQGRLGDVVLLHLGTNGTICSRDDATDDDRARRRAEGDPAHERRRPASAYDRKTPTTP